MLNVSYHKRGELYDMQLNLCPRESAHYLCSRNTYTIVGETLSSNLVCSNYSNNRL